MECENISTSLAGVEKPSRWLNRPLYHGSLAVLSLATLTLYAYELHIIHRRRRMPPCNSLFFALWKNQASSFAYGEETVDIQAFLDISTLLLYLLFGLARNISATWDIFLYTNETRFPQIVGMMCVYFFFGEICGVALISVQRLLSVCIPQTNLYKYIESLNRTLVFIVHAGFPLLFTLPIFNSTPARFNYSPYNSAVNLHYEVHDAILSGAVHPLCIACTGISFACYVVIFCRLYIFQRNRPCDSRERSMLAIAFMLFCSLTFVFVFYCIHVTAMALKDCGLVLFISAYWFIPIVVMAVTNPWSLLASRTFRTHFAGKAKSPSPGTPSKATLFQSRVETVVIKNNPEYREKQTETSPTPV